MAPQNPIIEMGAPRWPPYPQHSDRLAECGNTRRLLKKVQMRGRRPPAAREAYSLYVERAAKGADEADGPFSAAG